MEITKYQEHMMAQRIKNALSGIMFMIVFISICGVANVSYAQKSYSKLTEQNIIEFIKQTSEITSGDTEEMSAFEVTDYLDRHLNHKARFKSVIKFNIPGYPAQNTSITLNKKDFIINVEKGNKMFSDYKNKIEVISIKIAGNGKKATIQTKSIETGTMPINAQNGTKEMIPMEGTSICNQIIMLGKKGMVQMYSANCTTDIVFLQY